jgi:DNA-binding transcriptional MerR regulator
VLETRSYSLTELEKLSGFNRRTIVYYVQEGLLPKVGRRGPNTRYPGESLQRLRFIKGVRDIQTHGGLINITLGGIREALCATDPDEIRRLLEGGLPAASVEALFSYPERRPTPRPGPPGAPAGTPVATEWAPLVTAMSLPASRRSYGLADASIRRRVAGADPPAGNEATSRLPDLAAREYGAPATQSEAPASATPEMHAVDEAPGLGELLRQLEIRSGLGKPRLPPGASEQWTEIPITSRVFLSVRGLSDDDASVANAVARILRGALRDRQA